MLAGEFFYAYCVNAFARIAGDNLCKVVQVRNVFARLVVHPELVYMSIFIFHEGNLDVVLVFQIVEHAVQVLAKNIDNLGAHDESHFAETALGVGAGEPAVDHAKRRFERCDAATAVANRAAFGLFSHEVHADALTGDFHEAELANRGRANRGLVAADRLAEFLVNGFAVFIGFHIDEVDDDEAAHIAEAQLLCDFVASIEVCLENDLALVLAMNLRTRVHVDRDESFGLFDDEVATARKRDLTLQGASVVVFNLEVFKQAFTGTPELDLVELIRRKNLQVIAESKVLVAVVDIHVVRVVAEVFANRLFDGIGFFVDAGLSRVRASAC